MIIDPPFFKSPCNFVIGLLLLFVMMAIFNLSLSQNKVHELGYRDFLPIWLDKSKEVLNMAYIQLEKPLVPW